MNTKVITDPSALGWEQDGATANGTPIYKWAEGAEHPIVDGDTEGQVTTWDGAKWTPDSNLTIDPSGKATFGGSIEAKSSSSSIESSIEGGGGKWLTAVSGTGVVGPMLVFDDTSEKFRISAGSVKEGNNAAELVTITPSGDATFSGVISARTVQTVRGTNGFFLKADYGTTGVSTTFSHNGGGSSFSIKPAGGSMTVQGDFSADNVRTADGPVIDAKGLISTLTTLRNATKDETTIKGLRDAIGNAIGGLIEEFENQIAAMPAEDEA